MLALRRLTYADFGRLLVLLLMLSFFCFFFSCVLKGSEKLLPAISFSKSVTDFLSLEIGIGIAEKNYLKITKITDLQ